MIGNGAISARHKEAINHVGGELKWIYDPLFSDAKSMLSATVPSDVLLLSRLPNLLTIRNVDYVVICSPTYLHRSQIKMVLNTEIPQIICEKPLCLPWEQLIDDDRINVVLQLRWMRELPKRANLVKAVMARNDTFFQSWKGDPRKAGGNIYEFFIHYIDLAIQLGAAFEGEVIPEGKQVREIHGMYDEIGAPPNGALWCYDIMQVDMQDCYNRMYEDILKGKGIRPKDIFYLTWVLNRYSDLFGYRFGGIGQKISIPKEML